MVKYNFLCLFHTKYLKNKDLFFLYIYFQNTIEEWLHLLHLEQYCKTLTSQGYADMDSVTDITWEDLEEIGIQKLGMYLSCICQSITGSGQWGKLSLYSTVKLFYSDTVGFNRQVFGLEDLWVEKFKDLQPLIVLGLKILIK